MKVYRLYYIYSNNGENGVMGTLDIAESPNRQFIEDIIKKYNLKTKFEPDRGESKVFIYDSYDLFIPSYFEQSRLCDAFEDLERGE